MATKGAYTATYNANSYASVYIIAFIDGTDVYTIESTHIRNAWTQWAKTKNGKRKLRMHLNKKARKQLKKMDTCTYIGKAADVYAGCNNTGMENRGWRTERIVCEMLGIPWKHRKNEGAWNEDCDITIGNMRIQVKFESGNGI